MKNKYLTKKQKNDIAISILYDWSFGNRDYPSISTVASRISIDFISKFNLTYVYKLLTRLRTMMNDIEDEYVLTGFRNIHPTFVEYYAKEHGFHISPMNVLTQ